MNRRSQLSVRTTGISLCLACLAGFAFSDTREIFPTENLQVVIDQSAPGDTLILKPGTWLGNFVIDHALTMQGTDAAIIDAEGQGNALTVTASDVTLSNLSIKNWGDDLTETHAGIKIKGTHHVDVTNNHLSGDGFGIYVENSESIQIEGNTVSGNATMRSSDRGNGIHLINVQHSLVAHNRVSQTRDGLYIINSQHNRLLSNHMTDLRFAIHYMYSHSNRVEQNHAEKVDVGYALMSSRNLVIADNLATECRDYGLLLNFVNSSQFSQNQIDYVRSDQLGDVANDEGKALFVYNSVNNTFISNQFRHSDLGIHLTAGSEGNQFTRNAFINNQVQVKYVSSREQEWSVDQVGNYWSNYLGWDMNADGIGDAGFEPNDDIDKLLWKYPEADILMDSPAVLLLRWVQRSFPVLKSPGVRDSYPLYQITGALNE